MIERRSDRRCPVSQEVMLSQGAHFRLCQLKELSMSSAFLDIGWGVLTRTTPVDLMLTLPAGAQSHVFHLPAEVTRVDKKGTAVRFRSLDDATRRALSIFLS